MARTDIASVEGHWAVIGKRPPGSDGDRFFVRQDPFELDADEVPIATRYLLQAIAAVQRPGSVATRVTIPDADNESVIRALLSANSRSDSLATIVERLCQSMLTRGRPSPGIVFALKVSLSDDEDVVALIKADLNQEEMAQLAATEDQSGRMRLQNAENILEEPQSEFAKVLFAPAPHDYGIAYAVSDRKAGSSHAAAYFLEALGVESVATRGTLRGVVAAVAKDAEPPQRTAIVEKLIAAVDERRDAAPGEPVGLDALEESVPEAAETLRKLREDGPVRTGSVGPEDRVTRTWKLEEPSFELKADTRIVVEGPTRRGDTWVMTIELPSEPISGW